MNPRELIILVLGLAIVAVVLRGLFLALRARRGQIKLAIDKNIPKDIDLEALELAELPGGGARVVARNLESVNEQNSRLDEAQERAEALNLGKTHANDEAIPVLMDAVEVRSEAARSSDTGEEGHIAETHLGSEPFPQAEDSFAAAEIQELAGESASVVASSETATGLDSYKPDASSSQYDSSQDVEDVLDPESDFDDYGEVEPAISVGSSATYGTGGEQSAETQNDSAEELDDVLLDYGDEEEESGEQARFINSDPMAQIAPDYTDSDAVEQKGPEPEVNESELDISNEIADTQERQASGLPENSASPDSSEQKATAPRSFEEQLEDFSMSAGERIGYDGTERPVQPIHSSSPGEPEANTPRKDQTQEKIEQASLFSEVAESAAAEKPELEEAEEKSSGSFFAMFKRKPKQPEAEELPQRVPNAAYSQPSTESPEQLISNQERPPADLLTEVAEIKTAEQPADASPVEAAEPADTDSDHDSAAELAVTEPSEVLVLNVMAREGYEFAGDDLLRVLITAGLKFGEMNIFHHHVQSSVKSPVLFSVANVLNPGTFDLNNMSEFSTLGISFFLALPTSIKNMESFDLMLSVAQQVKSGLDGELRDDQRNLMTAQTIEHYRQRVSDFELRQLKAGIRSS